MKTAAALTDLRKDKGRSVPCRTDSQLGVADPLHPKAAGLAVRGKRVPLRRQRGDVLADYVLGRPVEGKAGYRYVRVPGPKRGYLAKTGGDALCRFCGRRRPAHCQKLNPQDQLPQLFYR